MKKPITASTFNASHYAIQCVHAYHAASAESSALWQITDCAALPDDDARRGLLVHIVLRAASECAVASALSDPGHDWRPDAAATTRQLENIIASFFGRDYAHGIIASAFARFSTAGDPK
jgi:hypothetical protein